MAMIDRNFTFATNGTVTANDLHNLIDSATIYQDLITGQVPITSVGTNYELLIADGTNPNAAPNAVTVYDLFEDALTAGTYTNANISAALTYGTATGTRLVSANATITTGTITTGVIPTLTSSTATFGTTTSTAATITSGTVTNLASTTGTIATLNSTTGTIGNLSTTLAGDFTISQGTGTLGTSGVTLGTYGGATSVPVIAIDAKGRITTASTSAITSNTGFRNRIINGDIGIWQRGTSFTAATYSHSADRWAFGNFVNTTVSQSTSVPTGFKYSLKVQRPAAATSVIPLIAMQTIESVNCLDMAGQSVTLSFYAKAGANYSAASSLLGVQLKTGTVADQGGSSYDTWTGAAQPLNTTVTLTTSFQLFTVTGTLASNVLEMAPVFFFTPVGTAGADDSFHITGVQLEVGSTATEFERRPIGTELALCQRYFYKHWPANSDHNEFGSRINTTAAFFQITTPVYMRSTPTAVLGSAPFGRAVGLNSTFNTAVGDVSALAVATLYSNSTFTINITHGSISAGDGVYGFSVDGSGNTVGLGLSAEL
jgi:hypothetical protein